MIFQEKAPHNVSMADVAKILLLSAAIFLVQSVLGKSIYIYMCVCAKITKILLGCVSGFSY